MSNGQADDELWSLPGYRITGVLGRGGFATVYQARQLSLGREVAVKVLATDLAGEGDRRRFDRERAALAFLSAHPHVVEVFDAGITPEHRPYLVMRLYPNGSLADRLARSGPLTASEASAVITALADVLDTAHAAGILHRDVKPANVLLTEQGTPVLADFGIAGVLSTDPDPSQHSTAFFSLAHVAPEILSERRYSVASDVYALASTTYQLLSGRPPFPPTDPRIGSLILDHSPPPLDAPGVPRQVAEVVLSSLAKDPGARPVSAGTFAGALAVAALSGTEETFATHLLRPPAVAAPVPDPPPPGPPASTMVTPRDPAMAIGAVPPGSSRTSRRLRSSILAAVLAVVIVGTGVFLGLRQSDRATVADTPSGATGDRGISVADSTTDPSESAQTSAPSETAQDGQIPTSVPTSDRAPEPVLEASHCVPDDEFDPYTGVDVVANAKPDMDTINYRAANLVDGDTSTAWVEGVPGLGEGEAVTFSFDRPVTVLMACVVNGYAKSSDLYRRNARVQTMDVVTDAARHTVRLSDLGLVDSPATFQQFPLPERTVTRVTLRLRSFYGPDKVEGKTSYQDTCLSEVVFWYRPSAG